MKKMWMISPCLFILFLASLLATWAVMDPARLSVAFDSHGFAPIEVAALPIFFACIPLVWWKCPFTGSRARRVMFCIFVTCVAAFAIVKELDLHQAVLHLCYPQYVGENGQLISGCFVKPNGSPLIGTPFKMRVLTNACVPFGMKAWILFYFTAFFGVFALGFLLLAKKWILGIFRLEASSWAWGCCGVSGLLVQVTDRLPAWLNHSYGLTKASEEGISSLSALCTCLEEGGELMLAIFALLTIIFAIREKRA